MKRRFCPRPLNENTFTATASLSSSSNTHSKPRCRLHRRSGPGRRRPHKSVAVVIFILRADTFLDPNSSFDGRLGSIATLHPTVGTSDSLRGGVARGSILKDYPVPNSTGALRRAHLPLVVATSFFFCVLLIHLYFVLMVPSM
jgi:hypothetical protein